MKPELIVIDSLDDAKKLKAYLSDKEYVAYDCETTGLTKRDRVIGFSVCAEESKAFYVILEKFEAGKLEPTSLYTISLEILSSLLTKKLICHNAVFDCMMAEAYFKVDLIKTLHTDTMILAHLLDENRRVGLKELAAVYFGESSKAEQEEMKASVIDNGGKLTKTCYEMYKCDSYIMGKYGAKDAWLTYKLFMELVPQLYEQDLDKFFYEEESMPLLTGPTYDLNTTGMIVDTNKLLQLKKTLEAECIEHKNFIYNEIHEKIKDKYPCTNKSTTFNVSAPQQLSWLLFVAYKLQFRTLTKAGRELCKHYGMKLPYTKSAQETFSTFCNSKKGEVYGKNKKIRDPWVYMACDKNTLNDLAPKYKWIQALLEYSRKMKLLNTYVIGIEDRINYGVINPSYLQHGTMTGRYASRNPNLQNLPRGDQRVKECFVARPGKTFVSADFSQLEPRIFSYYSKDKRLMDSFNGKADFYSVVGQEVFNKHDCEPAKEGDNAFGVKYKALRDVSKTIALATAYGATPAQLAPVVKKSIEDTAQDIEQYFKTFPGVKKMMLEAHELVKEHGYVTNLFGRVRRIPEALNIGVVYKKTNHEDLPYEARKLLNMACNFRIQSTGASIVNRAAIKFYNDCKYLEIDCKLISQIHDELVVECGVEDAEKVSLLLQNAMESTTKLEGIKLEAIPRITKSLAK